MSYPLQLKSMYSGIEVKKIRRLKELRKSIAYPNKCIRIRSRLRPHPSLHRPGPSTHSTKPLQSEVLKIETYLNGKYDDLPCYLEIHPGAGGTEAHDWANMLLRMYEMFCDKNNYKYEVEFQKVGFMKQKVNNLLSYRLGN